MQCNRAAKRTVVIAILLVGTLALESAPARAQGSYQAGGPSVSTILQDIGHALSPLASAGRAVGSWFNATFLAPTQAAPPEQTPVVPGEVPWKRSIASRTIRNANGSYTVESFTHPINYPDSGVLQPIDNTLVASSKLGYDWQNKSNGFGVHLKETLDDKPVALVVGGDTYTLSPQGLNKVKGGKNDSEATYEGVAAAVDLSYRVTETGLKETLTLRGPNTPTEFKYLLQGPTGMKVVPTDNGAIAVQTSAGKHVFSFTAPWAQENPTPGIAEPIDPSDRHVSMSVKEVELPAGFEITLSVDAEWLHTPGRRFPVIVDPPIELQAARETYVLSTCISPSCTSTDPGTKLFVGTDPSTKARTMLAFDITAVPFHSPVSAATLTATVNGCMYSCANAQTIEAHEFTAAWDSWEVTWDYADAHFGATLDTAPRSAGQSSGTMSWSSGSLTSVVQSWINAETTNNGFLLKLANETFSQGGPAYNSTLFGTASARPKLSITYTANANATSTYPPSAPGSGSTPVDLGNTTSSNFPALPLLPPSPARSLFRASTDGTLVSIENASCHRNLRAAKPPFQAWSSPVDLGCDDGLQAFMRTDDSGTLYTITRDTLNRGVLKRYTRSGTSTTWNNDVTGVFETVLTSLASVTRSASGRIWIAYSKIIIGDTTDTLVLKSSDNEGSNFSSQTNLIRSYAAQLVPLSGTSAGIVLQRFSDRKLAWRSSSAWASETVFPEVLETTDPFQAVADDQGRVHLVYQTAGGTRYRMRDAAGTWTPAPGSNGTVISSTDTQPTLTTDGTTLILMTRDAGDNIVRRTWNGSWSAPTVTVGPADPTFGNFLNVRGALPARLGVGSAVVPYLWEERDNFGSPYGLESHFNYLDQVAPGGSIPYPGDGEVLVGTITVQATPVDDVGVQRADFYADRGGGLIGYLGTDTNPADGLSVPWNTKQLDGGGKRLWPNGAYRAYAVLWDYKGNRGETNRPLSYVQDQDLGVRPYRPMLPVPIGAGLGGQVNLWNGNLTLTHALLSDPTVIGPLSISRTYNALDTQNGTAGRGWYAGADLDAEISFTKLVNHATDAEYPQNVVELVETDGTPHYYMLAAGGGYAPFIDDFSVLSKNGDGTWSLTLADGSRYLFDSTGNPTDYRTTSHSVDQPSFTYVYSAGKLSSITDPVGRGVTFTYDANGRLWKVTSNQASPARTWTLTYTATGELSDVQDPVNGATTTHFDYDATTKLMTQARTPAGVRIQFGYDVSKRVTEVRQLHTVGATTFTYITKVTYVDADTTQVTRPKGNISPCSSQPTCKAKYTTTFNLDSRYRLSSVQITLPDNTTKTKNIGWNNLNLKTSESDFSNNASSFTYDQAGNLLTERDPLNNPVTHRYDEPYNGLQGLYYNNTTLTPPAVLRRLDSQVNFTWPGSPGSGVNADNFSARWSGYLNIPTAGAYTFYTTADLASRLFLDGLQVIDNWTAPVQTEKTSSPLTLSAGLHPIVIEMNDTTGTAGINLSWQGPGISKQTVSSSSLKPGFNLETSRIDQLGNTTSFIYEDETPPNYTNDQDPFYGRLIEQKETNTPSGGSAQTLRTTFNYNSFGQMTSKTMPKGNTGGSPDPAYTTAYAYYGSAESATDTCTSTSYAQLGLLKSISQPGLATSSQVHDGAGNSVASTEGKGTTCSAFDALGRQTSMKAPDRATATTYIYDADGRLKTVTDPLVPASTNYTYDDLGRLATAKDAMAATGESPATYSYDEHSNVIGRTDKTGNYSYTPDELDRIVQLTDQALRPYTFAYDADGVLAQQNLPNATRTLSSYDSAGRLTAYRNQTSTGSPLAEYVYTYNNRGERLTEDGPQGLWVYTYDAIGRLEQAHDPTSGRTRRYVFDFNSNRSEIRLNQGWTTTTEVRTWNTLDGVLKAGWNGDNASHAYTLPFSFPFRGTNYTQAYVSTNGFLTLGTSGGTATTVDLATTSLKAIAPYARDLNIPANNPTKGIFVDELTSGRVRIRWKTVLPGTSTAANFETVLYSSGQIKFNYDQLPGTGTARVGVTAGNQLDFVAVPNYDRKTVPTNAQTISLTAATESVQASYGYNALDQITSGSGLSGISYSTDGEQTAITGPSPRGSWTFGYDGRGLMKTATNGTTTTTWTLDGERRVVKEVNGASETRERFAGPGDSPAWVEDDSGNVIASFLAGPSGLLTSFAGTTPRFNLFNGHGDVVQTRDLGGAQIELFGYDEYGNPTSAQTPTRYGYTGLWQKQRNTDTGLIRMGARMYDPSIGRFTARDPIEGGDLNAYLYAGSGPVNKYDLDGTHCKWYHPHHCVGSWLRKLRKLATKILNYYTAFRRRGWAGVVLYWLWTTSVVITCGALSGWNPRVMAACGIIASEIWGRIILKSPEFQHPYGPDDV